MGSHGVSDFIRSNVFGLIAIFIALGGTAGALSGKNKVDSGDIRKGNVKTSDIRANAVKGPKVADDSLTGADVQESSLNLPTQPSSLPPSGPAGGDLSGEYPDPHIAGNAVGSAELGADVVTSEEIASDAVGFNEIAPGALRIGKSGVVPAVRAEIFGNDSIPNAGTQTVPLDAEEFDTAGMHSNTVQNTNVTAPVPGIYRVSGSVRWDDNGVGTRFVAVNGPGGKAFDASSWSPAVSGHPTDQSVTTIRRLDAGESMQLIVFQDSGGALNLIDDSSAQAVLAMEWIGPQTVGTP